MQPELHKFLLAAIAGAGIAQLPTPLWLNTVAAGAAGFLFGLWGRKKKGA
jgi:hypothetical protein